MDLGEQLERRDQLEREIDHTNQEYIKDEPFQDVLNLADKLGKLKSAFMKHDPTSNGEIDYIALHAMAEDLGLVRTLAELKQRVQDVTGNTRNTISYRDCAMALLGCRSTMCQRIMRFSGQDGAFEKRPCWLDSSNPSYVSIVEFTVPSSFASSLTFLPPPPPPSPDMGAQADMGALENGDIFSATLTSVI